MVHLGESGREEQRLALTSAWHVLPLHNSPNLQQPDKHQVTKTTCNMGIIFHEPVCEGESAVHT